MNRRHICRPIGSTVSAVGMGALRHNCHAFVVDDWHLGAVGHPQHFGGYNLGRWPLGQNPPGQAHDPGQVDRHGVYFVGSDDDGHAVVVQVMEQMHDIVPSLDVHTRSRLVQQQ